MHLKKEKTCHFYYGLAYLVVAHSGFLFSPSKITWSFKRRVAPKFCSIYVAFVVISGKKFLGRGDSVEICLHKISSQTQIFWPIVSMMSILNSKSYGGIIDHTKCFNFYLVRGLFGKKPIVTVTRYFTTKAFKLF